MNRILLTGGTGFFGKNILKYIKETDCSFRANVTILSRNPGKFIEQFPELLQDNISFIKGDIRTFSLPDSFCCDYVIHGATEASAKLEKNNPQEMYSVIVDGTRHLLKEIKKVNKATKLLFVSSGGVYGKQPEDLLHIPEDFPCNPTTAYGKGKLEAEKLCLNSEISTSIARCFAFVGPYLPLDTHFAIGNFILNGLRNESIVIKGDGKSLRSYMYSEDLVEWLLKILIDGKDGEVYNVGSDKTVSIAELAETVNECFDNKLKIDILGQPISGASDRYVPSAQKAQRELFLNLSVGLKEAILNTIEFVKTNKT
jgi:nucleoside-diphosphate-sugar epimerase